MNKELVRREPRPGRPMRGALLFFGAWLYLVYCFVDAGDGLLRAMWEAAVAVLVIAASIALRERFFGERRVRAGRLRRAHTIGNQWRSEGFWIRYTERSDRVVVEGTKQDPTKPYDQQKQNDGAWRAMEVL